MRSIIFRLALALMAGGFLTGCAIPRPNATQQFVRCNPDVSQKALELYQVSIDHWVELELQSGLGSVIREAVRWRGKISEIDDPSRRQEAQRVLSTVIDETSDRYIYALTRLHEVRSRMDAGDDLIYCRNHGELVGYLLIVRAGRIKEKLPAGLPWEDFQREALWDKLLSQRK